MSQSGSLSLLLTQERTNTFDFSVLIEINITSGETHDIKREGSTYHQLFIPNSKSMRYLLHMNESATKDW